MKTAIAFDCEFLCIRGSQTRFWCGPNDPDPVIAQIGAVRLGLADDFPILDTCRLYVRPIDREGRQYELDPFFTNLTGITEQDLRAQGMTLQEALTRLDRFSDGATFWSWGKDELNMVAISCYVAGIAPVTPARRFDNAVRLFLAAGMPLEDLARTPSNKLSAYYGVDHPPLRGHDGLDDALSLAYALQHLLRRGDLTGKAFEPER